VHEQQKATMTSATMAENQELARSSLTVDDEDPLKDFVPLTDALVYATVEHGCEVMPKDDVNRIRVLLKESFMGIPVNSQYFVETGHSKIDKSHAHYHVALGMMIGIREAVGGMDGLLEAELDEQDLVGPQLFQECRRNRKYWFEQYQFKAYAPLVFARIRSHFNIDKQLFLHSICGNFSYLEFLSNAKSGSFFFFSHDRKYLIKTLRLDECHFLQSMLPKYYYYLRRNPNSFLTHFYGLYRLTTQSGQNIYFSIMKSVLDTPNEISSTYDLKGSTLGRRAEAHECVKKDLDILESETKLRVGPAIKNYIVTQLRRDSTFLAGLGIMDYSFLLGIHDRDTETNDEFVDEKKQEDQSEIEYQFSQSVRLEQQDQFVDWEHVKWKTTNLEEGSVNTSAVSSNSYFCGASDYLWAGSTEDQSDETCPFSIRDDRGIDSIPSEQQIYYAGIIDILQPYTTRKMAETVMRKAQGNSEQEISCVHPETYANRFMSFMSNLME